LGRKKILKEVIFNLLGIPSLKIAEMTTISVPPAIRSATRCWVYVSQYA